MATDVDLELVFNAGRVVQDDGATPAPGYDWTYLTANYRVADGDAARSAAVAEFRATLGRALRAFAHRMNCHPSHVTAVVLRGEWLRETLNDGTVHLDGAFTFRYGGECLRDADLGDRRQGRAWFVGIYEAPSGPPPCGPEVASDEPITVTTSR